MKQSLRFFSLGLLVSSLLLLGYSFISGDTGAKGELSVDEMIDALGEEGYRVVSEDEFIAFTLGKDRAQKEGKEEKADKQSKEKETKKESDKEEKEQTDDSTEKSSEDKNKEKKETTKDEPEVVKATIKTSSGVVTQDIADELVDKKIIKKNERDKFVKYLDDNDYSSYIQLGSFKVSSDMDFNQLANTFTTYPGN